MNELLTRDPVAFTAYYSGLTMTDFHCEMLYTIDHYPRSAIMLPAGHGKLLALDTPIPTPEGWTTIGEIRVGDALFAGDGSVCRVVAKSEVETPECYLVQDTREKSPVVAGADHLWPAVPDSHGLRERLYTSRELAHYGEKHRVFFYLKNAARMPRKAGSRRSISCVPTESVECQCIQVTSQDGTYLAGRSMLPTHNSTMMKWYVVYKIAQNRNVRIILLMKNQEEVNMYARAIRQELAANQQLLKDFGRFVPNGRDAVWSNDSIIVRGRQITEPQPTVLFASAATIDSVLGKRSDIVIADDIVTPTTVSTLAQRDKQWAIFNEGVETSPQYIWDHDRNGKLLVPPHIDWPMGVGYEKLVLIGTVFDTDDLFHRKVGNIGRLPHGKLVTDCKDPAYVALKFDCWTDKEKTKPLWPARWSAEKLRLKEKSVGTIEFNKRYRNIAIDEGSMVFKRIWVYGGEDGQVKYPGCLDSRRRMGDVPEDADYLIMGLDPSTGRKGRGTSFSAFVVIAVDRKANPIVRQIVDVYRAQLGFDDIISVITDGDDHHSLPGLHKLYDYDQGRVEANAAQTYLLDNARVKTYCLNHGLRLLPHETQTRQKNDPFVGVASMQEMVKNGWLRIPYADEPSTREKAEDFIEQLLNFPSEPYDFAMALYFAEVAVRGFGSSYRQIGNGYGKTIMNPRFQQSVA